MTYRDVGYARLSHADADEAGAIARQKQDIRRASERTGGQLIPVTNHLGETVDVLVDNAVSASKYARRKRKDYPLLLEVARAGLADRAVIYDLDRLLRIPRELEDLIDLVEELGGFPVVGCGPNSTLNLATDDGQFVARILVAKNAKESADLSRRLRRQIVQAAEQGKPHSGTGKARCFGYEDDGLTIRESEAVLIRQAAEDVIKGEPMNEIARRWNLAGVRTARRDTLWSNRTVRTVLAGGRTAGLRVHHRGRKDKQGNSIEQTFPAAWPAIIDEVTYRALKRKLAPEAARKPGRRTPFTGLFVAVVDGVVHPMRRDRNRSTPVYRTYPRFPGDRPPRMQAGPAGDLEVLVAEWLFVHAESGDLGQRIALRRQAAAARPAGEDPAELEAELIQLGVDKADGTITRPEWLAMRKRLMQRLRAAQAAEASTPAGGALAGVDVDLRARWKLEPDEGGYTTDRKRAILAEVFDRIEIAPGKRNGPGFDPSRVTPIWKD